MARILWITGQSQLLHMLNSINILAGHKQGPEVGCSTSQWFMVKRTLWCCAAFPWLDQFKLLGYQQQTAGSSEIDGGGLHSFSISTIYLPNALVLVIKPTGMKDRTNKPSCSCSPCIRARPASQQNKAFDTFAAASHQQFNSRLVCMSNANHSAEVALG